MEAVSAPNGTPFPCTNECDHDWCRGYNVGWQSGYDGEPYTSARKRLDVVRDSAAVIHLPEGVNTRISYQAASLDTILSQLRGAGWSVAVHNDYRQGGERFTFWLFTHENGRYVKGEGRSDVEALNMCLEAIG